MTATDALDPSASPSLAAVGGGESLGNTERFSTRLRDASRSAHAQAESEGALTVLLRGDGHLDLYRDLLTQLSFVYAGLESRALEFRAHPIAGAFVFDALTRLDSLRRDLDDLGHASTGSVTPLEPTARYVQRLAQVGAAGFVAHHYTRYLGDLSGGLAVGAAVRRYLGLAAGTSFFTFDGIANPKEFKDEYRRRLDTAAWSEQERADIIAETLLAYRLNTELQVAVLRS